MRYIYTVAPIPMVDTVNSHVGFYFFTGIMVCVGLMCIINSIERDFSDVKHALRVTIVAVVVAAGVSWNTGEIRHYVNEPVIARMHSNGQEVVSYTERVHKNNVTKYRLEPYVCLLYTSPSPRDA